MKFIKLFIILYLLVSNSMSIMKRRNNYKKKGKRIIGEALDVVGTSLNAWSGEKTLFCWKNSYGRGVGTVPRSCDYREELDAGLCYKQCNYGYYSVGPVCWHKCKPGYDDHGASCFKNLFSWYFKGSYGRGAGTVPTSCAEDEEYDAGLCYTKCKSGYYGVGPVCWRRCQGEASVDCGAACATNPGTCASNIFGLFKSLFDVFLNISETILTFGSAHIIKTSIELSVKATFTVAQKLAKEGASKEAIKKAITDSSVKNGEKITDTMLNAIVNKAFEQVEFDWKDFSKLDPTGITSAVMGFIKTGCE